MILLPKEYLLKTGPVDHADWNYRPILGTIQRSRFRLALRLIANSRFHRLLEIGYGSGVFLPELSAHCDELYGVDVHAMPGAVNGALAKANIKADLKCASATDLPFPADFLSCVVAVSSLEFVDDLDKVCQEVKRVLAPGGCFIVITAGYSPVVDLGLLLLTGKRAKDDSGDRRQRVVPALLRHFAVERQLNLPPAGSFVSIYRGFRCLRP